MFGFVQRAAAAATALVPAAGERVMTIDNPAMLGELVSRTPGPSVPRGSRIHLTFLDEQDPQRGLMEAELSRYAQVCGCEAAAVAVAIVLIILATGHFVFDMRVPLPGLWAYVAWAVMAVTVGALAKLSLLHHARRQLSRVYRNASALTEGRPT